MTQKVPSLLPNGLKDLLPPAAEKEASVIQCLINEFSKFGYARVKPPLVEFEDTLLAPGPGQALSHKTFRMMDPLSGKMMGLRADTTAQISRIANSRLSDEPRPWRLCYAADVLKINGTQLRPERQFCQVGCEMIGAETAKDDAEICLVALLSLNRIGIENLSIDLTIPSLVDDLFESFSCDGDTCDAYNKLLQKRDRDGIEAMGGEIAKCLVGLLDASGVGEDALKALHALALPKSAQKSIQQVQDVYQELQNAFAVYGLENISITIDLIERRGFDYQSGISFTLFSTDARGELGRGGRYVTGAVKDSEASGFTLYMDSVLSVVSDTPPKETKVVASKTDWQEIKKLQDAGLNVSRVPSE